MEDLCQVLYFLCLSYKVFSFSMRSIFFCRSLWPTSHPHTCYLSHGCCYTCNFATGSWAGRWSLGKSSASFAVLCFLLCSPLDLPVLKKSILLRNPPPRSWMESTTAFKISNSIGLICLSWWPPLLPPRRPILVSPGWRLSDVVTPAEAKTLPIYLNKAWTSAWSGSSWAITGKHNYKEDLTLVLNPPEIAGKPLDPPPQASKPQDQGRTLSPDASSSDWKEHKKAPCILKAFYLGRIRSQNLNFRGLSGLPSQASTHSCLFAIRGIESGLFGLLFNFLVPSRNNYF